MIEGSCLCGAVEFTIGGALRSPRYCHCVYCAKFTGTSPAAWAMADAAALTVTPDDPPVTKYNSGRGNRCFCARCGSPVWFESHDYPNIVAVPLGVLDGGDIPSPAMHIWTQSNPAWCTITDDLPRHDTYPEPG